MGSLIIVALLTSIVYGVPKPGLPQVITSYNATDSDLSTDVITVEGKILLKGNSFFCSY